MRRHLNWCKYLRVRRRRRPASDIQASGPQRKTHNRRHQTHVDQRSRSRSRKGKMTFEEQAQKILRCNFEAGKPRQPGPGPVSPLIPVNIAQPHQPSKCLLSAPYCTISGGGATRIWFTDQRGAKRTCSTTNHQSYFIQS